MVMPRREFVRRLPVLPTGLALGLSSLSQSGCAGAAYVVPREAPGGLAVPLSAVGPDGVFLQRPGMERPVWVGRDDGGELVALLAACTHQGCQPEPVADRLVCPCHGSEFARSGEVLEGPAERPLTRYAVVEDGDDLIVSVGGGGR